MSALFSSSSSQQRSKNLVEFKAGKMLLQGKTVKPDKRKGLVYAYQSDDTLMHFCWKDRTSGVVEDDLMIFPEDIEIKKITQCTTGRVYLLRFKSSNKKLFFWMQDPDAEKDEKNWRKLNDYLNNPPAPGSSVSTGERSASALSSAFGGDLSGNDLQSLLSSMNEQQIQQLLGISGLMPNSPSGSNASSSQNSRAQSTAQQVRAPATTNVSSTTTPLPTVSATTATVPAAPVATTQSEAKVLTTPVTTGTALSNQQRIQLSDLQNILGNLNPAGGSTHVDLADVVTLDVMAPILANKDVQERLTQFLPEGDILPKNETELRNTFTTPQFKRAMFSFGEALQSGQLGPLLQQFNLPSDVANAALKGDIEEFAKAMQEHVKTNKTTKKSANDATNDDEKMES